MVSVLRAGHFQRKGNVLGGGPVFQQAKILEHHAQPAAQAGHLVSLESDDVVPGYPHLSRAGPLLGKEQLHDGGLAGAGVPGEKYELALGDVKGHVLQGQCTVRIGFVYVGETDHGGKITVYPSLLTSQRLLQIGDDILRVLEPAAQPQEAVGNPDLCPALGPDALVRREPGLRDQRLDSRQAGRVGDHLEPLEEPLRRSDAALELEPHHAAESMQHLLGVRVIGVRRQPGVVHP